MEDNWALHIPPPMDSGLKVPATVPELCEGLRKKVGLVGHQEDSVSHQNLEAGLGASYMDHIPLPRDLDLQLLSQLYDADPTHGACVDIKALAITAADYQIVRRDEVPKKVPKDLRRYLEEVFADGISALLGPAQIQYDVQGNTYIEVLRDSRSAFRRGPSRITGFQVVPAFTMRTLPSNHATGCAFAQHYDGRVVFYRQFGQAGPTSIRGQQVVNEMVHVRQYSPSSYWYGIPRIMAALSAVYLWNVGMEYVTAILEKKGMPHYLVFMPGGERFVNADTHRNLNLHLNQMLAAGAGRILLVPLPQGTEAQIEQLNLNIPVDQLAEILSKARNQIARVHRVPPRLLSILEAGRLGGSTEGETQIEQFKRFTVRPLQEMWERVLNKALIQPNPAWQDWKIKIAEWDLTDLVRRMNAETGYVRHGIKDIDEVRAAQGMNPRGADKLVVLQGGTPILVDDLMEGKAPEEPGGMPAGDEDDTE